MLGAKAELKARAQRVTQAGRTGCNVSKGRLIWEGKVWKDAVTDGRGHGRHTSLTGR